MKNQLQPKNIHTHTYNVYTYTVRRVYDVLYFFQFLFFVRLPEMISKIKTMTIN